jgi:predicted PurR-regulated permease PerM
MSTQQQADPKPAASDWGTQAHVHTLVMLALTVIALYLCYRMAVPFLAVLAWALALAVLVLPAHRWLEMRCRSANLAAGLAVAAAALTVAVPITLVSWSMVDEAANGAAQVQARVDSGEWRSLFAGHPRLLRGANWIDQEFDLPATVQDLAGRLTGLATDFVRSSVLQAVELLLTFYVLFYFLRDRRKVLNWIRFLSPLSEAQMGRLYRTLDDTLHATLYGTFIVAMIQGALGGLMFWALGLPAPLLWGVVMGLLAIVPVLGAFLIWIPAALYLLLSGHPLQALMLTLWGTIVVGGIDNLLYPMLVGNRIHLHTVLVFISIVGGLYVFGAAGLILGPVVLTATTVLLEVWRYPDGYPAALGGATAAVATEPAAVD